MNNPKMQHWPLLIALVVSSGLWGQSSPARSAYDSLYQLAETYPDDSIARKSWLLHQAGRQASADGDLPAAVAATQRALELRLSDEINFTDEVLVSAFNIGSFLSIQGAYRDGLEYYNMVLRRSPNRKVGQALFQVGFNNGAMGEFTAGVRAMEAAAKLPPFSEDDYTLGFLKMELGHLHVRKGNPEGGRAAIPVLHEALALFAGFEDSDYERMLCLNYLGWAYLEAGAPDEAIRQLSTAEKLAKSLEIYDEDLSAIYGNLGLAHRRAHRPELALDYYRRALRVEKAQGEDVQPPNAAIATFLDNISTAKLASGQPDSALHYAREALRWGVKDYRPSPNTADNPALELLRDQPLSLLIFLQDKARAHYALGQRGAPAEYQAALATYRRADELLDQMRRDQLLEDTRNYWRADARALYVEALTVAVAAQDAAAAFYFMEKARARLLLDELSAGRAIELLPEASRERLQAAARATRQAGNTPVDLQRFRQLQDSIFTAFPAYAAASIGASPPAATALKTLLGDRALVEYFIADDLAVALVWSHAQGLQIIELSPPRGWQPTLRTWLQEVANPDQQLSAAAAKRLYDVLIAPLGLPAGAPLLIVPDGDLYLLPFGALLTGLPAEQAGYQDWPWLAAERSVHYAFSVQLLDFARLHRGRGNGRALGLAPVARLGPKDSLDVHLELPATLRTVRHLARLFPTDTLVNADAHRAAFRARADAYSLIHLGTHAYLEDGGSFLLHNAAKPRYTMLDLAEHQLLADLVVIGACETGKGDQLLGEGIASLGRGFARRGAPSLVMSLWSIDDATTGELLQDMYSELALGAGPGTGLHNAAKRYLATVTHPGFGHPYYWAGLVYYGPDLAVETGGTGGWPAWIWALLGVGGLLVLAGWIFRRRKLMA
ncbi:CHAT domain-containing protein [Neolewinella lacunae]|uniref:CHAT domain-containing protein n=1 Tax=Neolewinella lacunae TaxID=1517758 RepID=A0A923T7Q6_9BACT|nr:CHAT domain-containing tetratricopeptide repeat protein [Neolewinella lacunae]MBC6994780.1 CHAT domain-containing protein [Neolewinella lacunae]MDN3634402.1 CHAT domain-containing protein [Neolewinella lacunae]